MRDTQILMHKNIKVAECKFDSRGYLKKISKVFNEEHLPVCVDIHKEGNTPMLDLQRWILSRSLAVSRRDIAPLREFYGGDSFQTSNGISLFDCYWFLGASDKHKTWEEINAYDNWDCKKDSVYLMFAHPEELRTIDTNSPNLTIPGRSQRLWFKSGNDFILLYGDAQKEMASFKKANGSPLVAKREYVILPGQSAGQICVATHPETCKDVERISLEDFYNSCQDLSKSKAKNLEFCCEKYGIPNWKDFIIGMSAYDEEIGNTTRELCDVGVLRNPDTLEIIGFAKL